MATNGNPNIEPLHGVNPQRVAIYCHDAMCLGDARRNQHIAAAIVAHNPAAEVLLIASSGVAENLALLARTEVLSLPHFGDKSGLASHAQAHNLVDIRRRWLAKAIQRFDPDLLIVDSLPHGTNRELDLTLGHLRDHGHARCVLGLGDVLCDPHASGCDWQGQDGARAAHELYDRVWVYCDRKVHDPAHDLGLPLRSSDVDYLGYVNRPTSADLSTHNRVRALLDGFAGADNNLILCMAGGGRVGNRLALAAAGLTLAADTRLVFIPDPQTPPSVGQAFAERVRENRQVKVIEPVADIGPLLDRADRVIAPGDYDTVASLITRRKPALIVPRSDDRPAQVQRAERMAELDLVSYMSADTVSPQALRSWLDTTTPPNTIVRNRIDWSALDKIPGLVSQLIDNDNLTEFAPTQSAVA